MLLDYFKEIKQGKAKTFICGNLWSLQSEFQFIQADHFRDHIIVTHTLKKIPKEKDLIKDFVAALASAVYELWPGWYGIEYIPGDSDLYINEIEKNQELRNLSGKWLKKSIRKCEYEKIPYYRSFPYKIQSCQLALTLHPKKLIFAVYVEDISGESSKLLGLARAAEWFSKETMGSVALLLPEELKDYRELDSILYDSVFIPDEDDTRVSKKENQEYKFNIWPIEDKPHPLSPGEKKLAVYLSGDKELNGLFKFNKKITTVKNTNYYVDLLWTGGNLVIEIDGYRYHKSKRAFQADRTRDYELSVSDYNVLRLTHDEVMNDIENSVNKIRDMIDFLSKQDSKRN